MDERKYMVESQLISRGISDEKVLAAMSRVAREKFIPENLRANAYDDCALPIGEGQTISQPYMVAKMTELLGLNGGEKVLEIGTGSGYQAAVLAEIAGTVYTIDRIESLSVSAKKIFDELKYNNIVVLTGDGTLGYEKEAPYDAIITTAASPEIPQPLINQLKDNGRLVVPVGSRWQQILNVVTKYSNKIDILQQVPCVFVPLVGRFGWKSDKNYDII